MRKSNLLTLLFFIFIAVANAYADESAMEVEILKELNQIQKIGELKWNTKLVMEKKRRERLEAERNQGPEFKKLAVNE